MSDIYEQFNTRIEDLTQDEYAWLTTALRFTPGYARDGKPTESIPPWYDTEEGCVPFDWEHTPPEGEKLGATTLYSEGQGDVDAVLALLRAFIEAKRPDAVHTMTWSTTGYGAPTGGAAVISRDRVILMDLDYWAEAMASKVKEEAQSPHYVIRLLNRVGVDGAILYWNNSSNPGMWGGWTTREQATRYPEGVVPDAPPGEAVEMEWVR